jgi:hypothetical protein
MKKRIRNDEQLSPHHNAKVQLDPYKASASHTVGASNMASVRTTAGVATPPAALSLLCANTTLSACASAGAMSIRAPADAIQALGAMYPETPCNNLRMLELRSKLKRLALYQVHLLCKCHAMGATLSHYGGDITKSRRIKYIHFQGMSTIS